MMEVIKDGNHWEFISKSNRELRELEKQYQALGYKTWVNLFNACEGTWVLTVDKYDENECHNCGEEKNSDTKFCNSRCERESKGYDTAQERYDVSNKK